MFTRGDSDADRSLEVCNCRLKTAMFDVDSGKRQEAGAALTCTNPTRVDEILGLCASLPMFSQPFEELRFEDGGGDRFSAIDRPTVQDFECVGKPSSERQTLRFCERVHKDSGLGCWSNADLNTTLGVF